MTVSEHFKDCLGEWVETRTGMKPELVETSERWCSLSEEESFFLAGQDVVWSNFYQASHVPDDIRVRIFFILRSFPTIKSCE